MGRLTPRAATALAFAMATAALPVRGQTPEHHDAATETFEQPEAPSPDPRVETPDDTPGDRRDDTGGPAPDPGFAPYSLPDERAVQFHALVSQGFLYSTANNYLAQSSRGTFEFTEIAVNLTKVLSDDLRVGLQLFSRDLGPFGNYSAKFDWFYLDWRRWDWFGVRAGRVKIPFGLYNEQSDYDPGRVPVLLPQSVYPTTTRDFLLAATGVEAYGFLDLAGAGALSYRLVGGTIFIDPSGGPVTAFDVPGVFCARLLWEPPVESLRIGGSVLAGRIDGDALLPATVTFEVPFVLWVASVEYTPGDLRLAAEYSQWTTETTVLPPGIVPNARATNERAYVSAAWRLSPLLDVGLYYALFLPRSGVHTTRETYQHDVAFTVRFDLAPYWLLKLEAHALDGTAYLDPALNDGVPRSALNGVWGLFLAKTTAYF